MKPPVKNSIWFVLLSAMVMVFFFANLWYGSVLINWKDVWEVLTTGGLKGSFASVVVLEYRLPQAITAMATGMSLGVAGLLLQTLFRNPLAGPSVLGISSGASLGVALVVLAGGFLNIDLFASVSILGNLGLVLAAYAGSLLLLAFILFVSKKIGNIVTVLIIGIMIGYMVSAIVGVLQFFSRAEELHAYVLWGLGSFSKTSLFQSIFLMIFSLAGLIIAVFYIKPLNALLLGERYAKSIGVNTRLVQTGIIVVTGFLIATATAFTGPIAFVGLAVPHLARNLFGTSNHGVVFPAVVLIGASLTLFCNLVAKLPGLDTSLPINAVTSVIGAPVVIWVIIKSRKLKQ